MRNYEIFYRTYTVVHLAGSLLAISAFGNIYLVDLIAFPAFGFCHQWYIQPSNSHFDVPIQSGRINGKKVATAFHANTKDQGQRNMASAPYGYVAR
ncbi:hypothetical protein JMN32_11830 [Fulvivirga sp. 29W222]|uniref:Uncharacterized protein n=1 Tax=Fulvivirga marina TaxID=2494733 RepID=A0A937KEA1_9BACT|nr:hypothetical protein [Fulvivirga marina]MBL6447003.1 hypothetical protein [Fulvivirga marina]